MSKDGRNVASTLRFEEKAQRSETISNLILLVSTVSGERSYI